MVVRRSREIVKGKRIAGPGTGRTVAAKVEKHSTAVDPASIMATPMPTAK